MSAEGGINKYASSAQESKDSDPVQKARPVISGGDYAGGRSLAEEGVTPVARIKLEKWRPTTMTD